jgi:DNA polymerase III epsilon subunit-like protein
MSETRHGETPARQARFAVIDFETTGAVTGWPVEPWQVGVVTVCAGRVEPAGYESLLRVAEDRPFNPRAPGRHGRLRARLARAPSLPDLWPRLGPVLLAGPLAGHQVGTERSMLARAAPLHRFGPWVDTLRLVRRAYPRLASAALEDAVAALELEAPLERLCPGRAPHDALRDAFACALLLAHFLHLPGWQAITVADLAEGH